MQLFVVLFGLEFGSCNQVLVDDALEFLKENSNGVAIIDTVNGTINKRKELVDKVHVIA
jgi:hypothetical protein